MTADLCHALLHHEGEQPNVRAVVMCGDPKAASYSVSRRFINCAGCITQLDKADEAFHVEMSRVGLRAQAVSAGDLRAMRAQGTAGGHADIPDEVWVDGFVCGLDLARAQAIQLPNGQMTVPLRVVAALIEEVGKLK